VPVAWGKFSAILTGLLLLAIPQSLVAATIGPRSSPGFMSQGAGTIRGTTNWPSLQPPVGAVGSFPTWNSQPFGRGSDPRVSGPRVDTWRSRSPTNFFNPMNGRWLFRGLTPQLRNPHGFHQHRRPWPFIVYNPLGAYFYNPVPPYFAYNPFTFYYAPSYFYGAPGYVSSLGYAGPWSGPPVYYAPPALSNSEAAGQPAPVENASDDPTQFAQQGEAAFKARDYEAATRAWRHALIDDPDNGELMLQLAQALFATGHYTEAAGAMQQALALLAPEKWVAAANSNLNLYTDSQDYKDQLSALEDAERKNPNDPALRLLLGFLYGYSSRPGDASRELDKLLGLAPRDQIGRRLRDLFAEKAN
jgi:Tetratricopeptide repeat